MPAEPTVARARPFTIPRAVRALVGAQVRSVYLPKGMGRCRLQFLLFFLAYHGYQLVRGITDGGARRLRQRPAGDRPRALAGHLLRARLPAGADRPHPWLIDFANFIYLNSHFVITPGFLVWLYLFRNEHFYFVRNMFMVAMGLALVGYALFPTAPPRLFPGDGFTDTIATFTGVAQDSETASLLVNKYAAVPSMHIAFSLMIAVPAAALSRHALARTLWSAYPLLVFFVIVATGNHFWFDAAAGAAVACLAALAARAARPGAPGRAGRGR